MFEIFKLYSGIFVILIPVVFVAFPYIFIHRHNRRLKVYSDLSKLKKTKMLFKVAMFFTAISQVVFSGLIIEYAGANPATILCFVSCFGTFGISIFNLGKYRKFHDYSSYIFFLGVLTSFFLNAFYFFDKNIGYFIVNEIIFLIELSFIFMSIPKRSFINVEYAHSVLGSVWVISAYIFLIIPHLK